MVVYYLPEITKKKFQIKLILTAGLICFSKTESGESSYVIQPDNEDSDPYWYDKEWLHLFLFLEIVILYIRYCCM